MPSRWKVLEQLRDSISQRSASK